MFIHKLEKNGFVLLAKCPALDNHDEEYIGKGLSRETLFYIYNTENPMIASIGRFTFAPMPGCCGIVVSCFTWLHENHRRSSWSPMFRELKEEVAKRLGYSMMIATTQMDNIPAVQNMLKSKYHICRTFNNKRTNHLLGLGYKVLT